MPRIVEVAGTNDEVEFPDEMTDGQITVALREHYTGGPAGKPLYAGKAKGEEPQLAGLPTTGGIEGVLPSEPEDVTPGPITGGPDDSSVAYGPQKPQPQVPLLDRIASYFKAPQEQPPPGIANKPDIARLWAQQQTENAGIPSDAMLALKSGLGILPWAAQTPPLAVPAKPGVPLTPTGQPIQTTEPTGQAIDYVLGKGQQASRAVAEHFIPLGPPQPNTNEEVLGGDFAPNSAEILPNITDPGLRELGRQIISSTQPTTTAPGFAAAMVQPEMVGLAAAGGMLQALKQAKLAGAVGRAAVSYFSAEGVVGGVKAAEVLADPNAPDEARAAAIAQIPTSVIMAALAPMHAAGEIKARGAEDVARTAEGKDLFASIEADKAREEAQPAVVPPPEPPVVPAEPGPIQRGTVQTPQITDADRAYLEAQTPAPEQPTVPPVAEPVPPPVVTERQQIPASVDVLAQPPLEGSIQRWADQNAKTLVSNDEVRLRKSLPQQISAGNVPDEALDWVRDMGSREEAKTAGNEIRDRILEAKKTGAPQATVRSLKTLEQLVWMKEKALAPYDSVTKSASADRLEKYLEARRAINVEHERVLADRAKRDVSDFVAEAEKAPTGVFPEPIAKELATDPITPEEIALAERSLHEADSTAEGAEAATPPYRPGVGERGAEATGIPEAAAPAPEEARPADQLQQPKEAVYAGEPEPGGGELGQQRAGPRGAVEPSASEPGPARAEAPEEGERFSATDPTAGIFNDIFGTREPRSKTRVKEEDPLSAARPEVEERLAVAEKGLASPTVLQRVREAAGAVASSFRQHFPDIDSRESRAMALNQDLLRQHESAPEYAKQVAIDALNHIGEPLDKDGAKVFQRILALRDVARSVEEGLYDKKELPFGYESLDEVRADLSKYEGIANLPANTGLQEALKRRERFAGDLTRRLAANDLLPPDALTDPRYYHRQVLAYFNLRDPQFVGTGSSDVRLHRKGFQRERVGGSDFNMKYQEAEFEWTSQATSLLSTVETLRRLEQVNNIAPALRLQAKLLNDVPGAERKIDWKELIPETHPASPQHKAVVWQPEKGSSFYIARTFPERALAKLDEKLAEGVPGVSAEEVRAFLETGRDALARGGPKEEWVIPENLAKTLNEWQRGRTERKLERVQGSLLTSWKQWVLLNPVRALKYNLNNESGDLDAVLAAYPSALKELPRAARDLWRYNVKESVSDRELVAELQGWQKRGAIGSGFAVQEIPDINQIGVFKALTSENPNVAQRALTSYWVGVKKFSTWRENTLRLAVARHLLGRIKAGETGLYGASTPEEIRAVPDPMDRAAKLSRELVGDYGNISDAGQYIRRHLVPFYAWMEINLPRYAKLLRNSALEEGGSGRAGRSAILAGGSLARFAIKASIFYGAVQAWNNLVFPNEEKKLGRDRRQLHLILGTAADGTIRSIRLQGALSDALDWFGLGNVVSDVKEMRAGKKTMADMAAEAVKAPADKIVQGWEPMSKTLFELRSGTRSYPSIFKEGAKWEFQPRPIRDRAEYAADIVWPLGDLYRKVTGKPKRPAIDLGVPGAGNVLESLLVFKTDPGEASYWATQDLVRRWKESHGKGGGGVPELGGETKKKSDALYYFRKASEWGDDAAAKKWLGEYFAAGGDVESLVKHTVSMSPLSGLPLSQRGQFLASLPPQDRDVVREAQEWSNRGKASMMKTIRRPDLKKLFRRP